MTERPTRDRIIDVLRNVPVVATPDGVIEEFPFHPEVKGGIAELDSGLSVPHEEGTGLLGL